MTELRSGLSNNTIQYKDKETGQIITTTSSRTRKALEKQLDQAIERQTEINTKVDELNEQLFAYETEIVEIKTGTDLAGELGPLKYLSGLTGIPMDRIINYLLLTIIFVFDPLAISLVIAANFAFEKLRPKTRENIYGEKEIVDDDGMWTEEEMKDFNNQFNADDLIPDEDKVKINPQLQINFDQRIPDLEDQIQQLSNELTNFKNQISAVVMFEGLEEKQPTQPTQEEYVEARLSELKSKMLLGEFRERRLKKTLEQEYKDKRDKDEDLTIIY